jgi:hypothetical protein
MTSVDVGNGVSDDVLDVESARGTLKPARAAALNALGGLRRFVDCLVG